MGVQTQRPNPHALLGLQGVSTRTSPADEPMPDATPPRGKIRSREEFESDITPVELFPRNTTTQKIPENEEINCDDIDFAEDDWDGRIQRCKERMDAAVYKDVWKRRLDRLKAAKATQSNKMKQYPGKTWEVVQRIEALQKIEAHLRKIKDPLKELPNVLGIMKAYKKGHLEWEDNGSASYWCQGRMIAGPEQFSFERFKELNNPENRGDGGFWVEGIHPLAPSQLVFKSKAYREDRRNGDERALIRLRVRLSHGVRRTDINGKEYPTYLVRCIEDSGSSMMTIFNDDMLLLMGDDAQHYTAPMEHLMGYQSFEVASGRDMILKIIAVHVNLAGYDEANNRVELRFAGGDTSLPCAVYDEDKNENDAPFGRLSGSWVKHNLYTATAPDEDQILYIGKTKSDITARDMLPATFKPYRWPSFYPPLIGTGLRFNPTSNKIEAIPDPSKKGRKLDKEPKITGTHNPGGSAPRPQSPPSPATGGSGSLWPPAGSWASVAPGPGPGSGIAASTAAHIAGIPVGYNLAAPEQALAQALASYNAPPPGTEPAATYPPPTTATYPAPPGYYAAATGYVPPSPAGAPTGMPPSSMVPYTALPSAYYPAPPGYVSPSSMAHIPLPPVQYFAPPPGYVPHSPTVASTGMPPSSMVPYTALPSAYYPAAPGNVPTSYPPGSLGGVTPSVIDPALLTVPGTGPASGTSPASSPPGSPGGVTPSVINPALLAVPGTGPASGTSPVPGSRKTRKRSSSKSPQP